jgi:hypothetical protein
MSVAANADGSRGSGRSRVVSTPNGSNRRAAARQPQIDDETDGNRQQRRAGKEPQRHGLSPRNLRGDANLRRCPHRSSPNKHGSPSGGASFWCECQSTIAARQPLRDSVLRGWRVQSCTFGLRRSITGALRCRGRRWPGRTARWGEAQPLRLPARGAPRRPARSPAAGWSRSSQARASCAGPG